MGQRNIADERQRQQQMTSGAVDAQGGVGVSAAVGDVGLGTSASGDVDAAKNYGGFYFGAPVITKNKVPYLWLAVGGIVLLVAKKRGWL